MITMIVEQSLESLSEHLKKENRQPIRLHLIWGFKVSDELKHQITYSKHYC